MRLFLLIGLLFIVGCVPNNSKDCTLVAARKYAETSPEPYATKLAVEDTAGCTFYFSETKYNTIELNKPFIIGWR